jgi:hypothetical protein
VIVLRDGGWSVWCGCGYRSPASLELAGGFGPHCGSGGSPAYRGVRAAAPLQGGRLSSSRRHANARGREVAMSGKCSNQPGPAPPITDPTAVDNAAGLLLVRFAGVVKSSSS